MSDNDTQLTALNAALSGENAAIYAYGLIGAAVPAGAARDRALRALAAHQSGQQGLRDALIALGAVPAPPAAVYDTGGRIDSTKAATTLASSVEKRMVRAWSGVASATTGDSRKTAVQNAIECANRAMSWGAQSQAFPG